MFDVLAEGGGAQATQLGAAGVLGLVFIKEAFSFLRELRSERKKRREEKVSAKSNADEIARKVSHDQILYKLSTTQSELACNMVTQTEIMRELFKKVSSIESRIPSRLSQKRQGTA